MKTDQHLRHHLGQIDGKGYKAYKGIKGVYRFSQYDLFVDHVQGDPFASPSRLRVRVDRKSSGLKTDTTSNPSRILATCDFLIREFHKCCLQFSRGNRGSGKSGLIIIDSPGQEILQRSAMIINDRYAEARFFLGLPARGRRIAAKDAMAMFFEELPKIVDNALFFNRLNAGRLYRHIETAEDADDLRHQLEHQGLIGFVANDSLLPRTSGIDPHPLNSHQVVRFKSPKSFAVDIQLPNRGKLTGMGIPKGVTLIVGGGYHGKSTLLKALELGIYNHIPGDGREFVVSQSQTVKIRAAEGRRIEKTDISPFINQLPLNQRTDRFSTENASGSTSQAANIVEAVEAGAKVLLLDEDTSATNFMIRDYRMQQLVSKDKEPITPFIDKIRQLYVDKGVSTVLVMGGSGDYFSVADHVIQMTDYLPGDVTEHARRIANADPSKRLQEGGEHFGDTHLRIPVSESFNPFRRKDRLKISASRFQELLFGRTTIDLTDMDQIVDISQTRALGYAIFHATQYMDGEKPLKKVVESVMADIQNKGVDVLAPYITGDLAAFRGIELAGAINRMRTLQIKQNRLNG